MSVRWREDADTDVLLAGAGAPLYWLLVAFIVAACVLIAGAW